ncbi:hypothetical protein SNEBB_005066 [Seison nebaliae]|nr:hypothetical protein SNEBB_005066 [Seison nebaliae]
MFLSTNPLSNSVILLLCFFSIIQKSFASLGDRTTIYGHSLRECLKNYCDRNGTYFGNVRELNKRTDIVSPYDVCKLIGWSCDDECHHYSMWSTVKMFEENEETVPQFRGKWPFYRIVCMQEPTSTIFSLFNGIAHLYLIIRYRSRFSSSIHCSLIKFWTFYAIANINAWTWSIIYHTRETSLTERLDYIFAFSITLLLFYSFIYRISISVQLSKLQERLFSIFTYFILFIFALRSYSLLFNRSIDYGTNLKYCVATSALCCLSWLTWSYVTSKNHRRKRYRKRATQAILLLVFASLSEILDFSSSNTSYMLDAHALWHLLTIPVTFIWYDFLELDSNYLLFTNMHSH